MIRVARIPYLNSAPFYLGFPEAGFELTDLPPRQLGDAARDGRIDAGILSLCDTFELEGFEPLGPLGVAVKDAAHSVLLFSRRPVGELSGCRIGVTTETATSIRLLELLLGDRLGLADAELVRRQAAETGDEGLLLIGDAALRQAARVGILPGRSEYGPGPVALEDGAWAWMLDLGAAWRDWQGLPFVFARWMVRTAVEAEAKRHLRRVLEDSLRASYARPSEASLERGRALGLDDEAVTAYLEGFGYRFGLAEDEAIDTFRSMIESGAPAGRPAVRQQA